MTLFSVRLERLGFENRTLIRDVALDIDKGEKIALIGETGTGKSSFLHLFNRMNESYSGSVHYNKQDIRGIHPENLRSSVIEVMQEPFLGRGSVEKALRMPFGLAINKTRTWPEERILMLFDKFSLPRELLQKGVERLSGGEKQRVALVRALVMQPDALLLDEPSSALDKRIGLSVLDFLLRECTATLLCITHDPQWQKRFSRQLWLEDQRLRDERVEGVA